MSWSLASQKHLKHGTHHQFGFSKQAPRRAVVLSAKDNACNVQVANSGIFGHIPCFKRGGFCLLCSPAATLALTRAGHCRASACRSCADHGPGSWTFGARFFARQSSRVRVCVSVPSPPVLLVVPSSQTRVVRGCVSPVQKKHKSWKTKTDKTKTTAVKQLRRIPIPQTKGLGHVQNSFIRACFFPLLFVWF